MTRAGVGDALLLIGAILRAHLHVADVVHRVLHHPERRRSLLHPLPAVVEFHPRAVAVAVHLHVGVDAA